MRLIKQYLLYLGRWQLSTPILAIVVGYFAYLGEWWAAIIANLIGALIFFWVDRIIFKIPIFSAWEVRESIKCVDCNVVTRGYRLVKTKNYDRLNDKYPEFRCESCSQKKSEQLKKKGVII